MPSCTKVGRASQWNPHRTSHGSLQTLGRDRASCPGPQPRAPRRAGGVPAILGALHRQRLLHDDVHTIHAASLEIWLKDWDTRSGSPLVEAVELCHAAPGRARSAAASFQSERWSSPDLDAVAGCIRDVAHAYSTDGFLAELPECR